MTAHQKELHPSIYSTNGFIFMLPECANSSTKSEALKKKTASLSYFLHFPSRGLCSRESTMDEHFHRNQTSLQTRLGNQNKCAVMQRSVESSILTPRWWHLHCTHTHPTKAWSSPRHARNNGSFKKDCTPTASIPLPMYSQLRFCSDSTRCHWWEHF